MALNYPGPYTLKLFYDVAPGTVNPFTHVAQYNIDLTTDPSPGTPFTNVNLQPRTAAPIALATAVNNWVGVVKAIHSAADTTYTHAELWKNIADSFDSTYVSSYTLGIAGTVAGSAVAGQEEIYTFRTYEGGIMKLTFLECKEGTFLPKVYADLDAARKTIVDYVVDDLYSYFLGRDTSYPLIFLKWFPGQSEHVFKKRYRQ